MSCLSLRRRRLCGIPIWRMQPTSLLENPRGLAHMSSAVLCERQTVHSHSLHDVTRKHQKTQPVPSKFPPNRALPSSVLMLRARPFRTSEQLDLLRRCLLAARSLPRKLGDDWGSGQPSLLGDYGRVHGGKSSDYRPRPTWPPALRASGRWSATCSVCHSTFARRPARSVGWPKPPLISLQRRQYEAIFM